MAIDAEQMVPLGWFRRSVEKRGALAVLHQPGRLERTSPVAGRVVDGTGCRRAIRVVVNDDEWKRCSNQKDELTEGYRPRCAARNGPC